MEIYSRMQDKLKDVVEKIKATDEEFKRIELEKKRRADPNEELLLLAAQSQTVTVFELSGNEGNLNAKERWSYDLSTSEDFEWLREFRMLDENHFIVCGNFRCS